MNKIMVLCLCIFLFIPIVFSDTCDTTYLDDNTIVHYSFEETSKPYIDDTETINLTLGTDPERIDVSGSLNYTYGQNFTGSDESYSTANTLLKYDVFSFCYWYRADDITGSNMGLASYQTTQYGPGWRINMHKNDGSIVFDVYDGSANRDGSYNTVGSISEDVWYHACNVWDGDDGFTYIKGSSSIHYGDAHDTIAYAATQGLYVGNTEAFFSTADWSVAGWVYFDVALNETCRSYVRSNTYPYSDVVPPVISNINCTSCDANNITADRTPTFTLDTDESSNCGISSQNSSYTNCTTTGVLNHTCTIPVVDQLDYGIVNVFFNCTDALNNSRTTSVEIEVTLINISFVPPTPANGTVSENLSIEINVSMTNIDSLEDFSFEWDGTNYTLLDENTVLFYNFNNVSSIGDSDTTAKDLSRYDNNDVFKASGEPAWDINGKYHGALRFDGTDDLVNLTDDFTYLAEAGAFTISFWVKSDEATFSSSRIIFGFGTTANWVPLIWGVNGQSRYKAQFKTTGGATNDGVLNTDIFTVTDWNHFIFTWDGTNFSLYQNGEYRRSDTTTGSTLDNVGGHKLIGAHPSYGYWDGLIDEFTVMNRSINNSEAKFIYESNLNKYDTDAWDFEVPRNTSEEKDYIYQVHIKDNLSVWNSSEKYVYTMQGFPPILEFVPPTPANSTISDNTSYIINMSITNADDLEDFIFNWNGNNYTSLNASTLLFYNLNNISSIGESDTTVIDLSRYKYNGTITGAEWTTDGVYESALLFDGTSNNVNIGNLSELDGVSKFTIAFWVKPAETLFSGSEGIIGRGSNAQRVPYIWGRTGTAAISFQAETESGAADISKSVAVNMQEWNHLLYTWDGTTMNVYLNGSFYDDDTSIGSVLQASDGDTYLGYVDPFEYLNGTLDEVIIMDRFVSAFEAEHIYASNLRIKEDKNWNFITNKSNLTDGTYTYQAFAKDNKSNWNESEERELIVGESPFEILYPVQYVTYQKDNRTHGEIKVVGVYDGSYSEQVLQAQYKGGDWINMSSTYSGGEFTAYVNLTTGYGTLIIRMENYTDQNASINNIGIADLFIISGQSNAEGNIQTRWNYTGVGFSTAYTELDRWKFGNDPIDENHTAPSNDGSAFPLASSYLSNFTGYNISFISTARGGTAISEWMPGEFWQEKMIEQVKKATNGTMKIKGELWYQGESDITNAKGYEYYKESLSTRWNDTQNRTGAEIMICAQVNRVIDAQDTEDYADNIRRAQTDLWVEDNNISEGPLTYDVNFTHDDLHFYYDDEARILGNRWYHAINYGVYGNESSKQPYLVGDVYYFNSTRIRLTYNENIAVKYYNGTTASIPKGFKITNGSRTLDDDNIISSEIVGSSLYLDFNQEIQLGENLTYGSGLDSYGKPVIISNVTSLPVKPIFNYVLIATKPEYSLNSTNYTDSASIVEHRLFWESESVGLSGHIFSINNGTGIFVNDSWVSMTGSANWSNVTKYINGTAGNNIQFKYFVNDTENGWTESDTYNYITTGALDTCTYSGSGDWEVDCNDNCTITTNTDTTTNALIINGAVGYFELLANVTCEMFAIEEGCQFRNKMNDNKRLAVKED